MASISNRQKTIYSQLGSDSIELNWRDWRWHLRHAIRSIAQVEHLLNIRFPTERRRALEKTLERFPLSVTPYYLSLIDPQNYDKDPVFLQAVPQPEELVLDAQDMADPLEEDKDSPVPLITHRYPDRVLFHISNLCSMYCRHCTRKRKVGDIDNIPSKNQLQKGLEYIRSTPAIRDVLLSGGDPLMMSESQLDWLLGQLRTIPHVEIIRLGTRMPVVLPFRITDSLISVLKKYHPLWVNTHFNHPRELTGSACEALAKLADAGIPLGNQTVLLAKVNDCPRVMKSLVHRLVINRVRPYYLYQCDLAQGLGHFRTPVGKGIEIMENLIGHTTGFAVPTYVIDAPGGGGKIPVLPNYLVSWSSNRVVLRNYEGVITTYKEPDNYENTECDRNCRDCRLELRVDPAQEYQTLGIARLLDEADEAFALTPADNERLERRLDDGSDEIAIEEPSGVTNA